jgi:F0F1-type ATP synthase membrane subunit a
MGHASIFAGMGMLGLGITMIIERSGLDRRVRRWQCMLQAPLNCTASKFEDHCHAAQGVTLAVLVATVGLWHGGRCQGAY